MGETALEKALELLKFNDVEWYLYMDLFVTCVLSYRLIAWTVLAMKVRLSRW